MLRCGHTYCSHCLSAMLKREGEVKCPLDHQVFRIANVDDLPKNFATEHMIVELKHKRSQAVQRVAASGGLGSGLCEFCDEAHAASHRCLDCRQNMCKHVAGIHCKAKLLKDHFIQELDLKADLEAAPAAAAAGENGPAASPSVCAQHGRAYEFYDQHCKTIMCSNCSILSDDHRGHKCVTLDVAAAESRASLDRLESAARALATELKTAGDGVDVARAALDAFCQSEEKRVHEVFEEVSTRVRLSVSFFS